MEKSLEKLGDELSKLPDNFVVSVIIPSDYYKSVSMYMLNYLLNEKQHNGAYISLNRPFDNLLTMFDEKQINHSGLFFIDGITKRLSGMTTDHDNVVFLDGPENLTDMGIALHKYTSVTNSKKSFIYIDSVSTLCIHNSIERVQKFIHYLSGKMRLWGINGVMVALNEDTDKRILSELTQFSDKVIHLK
jgi:hypothetical protein